MKRPPSGSGSPKRFSSLPPRGVKEPREFQQDIKPRDSVSMIVCLTSSPIASFYLKSPPKSSYEFRDYSKQRSHARDLPTRLDNRGFRELLDPALERRNGRVEETLRGFHVFAFSLAHRSQRADWIVLRIPAVLITYAERLIGRHGDSL